MGVNEYGEGSETLYNMLLYFGATLYGGVDDHTSPTAAPGPRFPKCRRGVPALRAAGRVTGQGLSTAGGAGHAVAAD